MKDETIPRRWASIPKSFSSASLVLPCPRPTPEVVGASMGRPAKLAELEDGQYGVTYVEKPLSPYEKFLVDLGGQARFGPSFEWVDTIDYTVDAAGADHFYAEVRRYWPGLPDGVLQPGYAGIRPKISGPGEPAADFRIDGPALHGVPGLVNLFGIESPGLTSCLAIGEHVASLISAQP